MTSLAAPKMKPSAMRASSFHVASSASWALMTSSSISLSLKRHRGGAGDSGGPAFRFLRLDRVQTVGDKLPSCERAVPGLCEREVSGAAEAEVPLPTGDLKPSTGANACANRDEAYIAAHRAGWKNPKHAAQWPSTLSTYVYPIFGALPVLAIDTGLVMKAIEPIWTEKPETASRVRGRIESVLDWAAAREYRQGENPARWRAPAKSLAPRGLSSTWSTAYGASPASG